jgi:cell shape-determining protein MreD
MNTDSGLFKLVFPAKIGLMKWWLLIPAIFFTLIQTTITSFNFLLVMILILALLGTEREAIVFAFLGGLLLDLSAGRWLGISSLVFLIPVGIVIFYSRRFHIQNLLFWLVIYPISIVIYELVFSRRFDYQNSLIFLGLGLAFYRIFNRLGLMEEKEEEGIRLRI